MEDVGGSGRLFVVVEDGERVRKRKSKGRRFILSLGGILQSWAVFSEALNLTSKEVRE